MTATDAKERQHWINLIRAVAEYHSQTALAKPEKTLQPNQENLKRSSTVSVNSTSSILKSPGLIKSHSMKLSPRIKPSKSLQPTPTNHPPKLTNPIQEELKNIKDALNSVAEFQSSAVEALEVYY